MKERYTNAGSRAAMIGRSATDVEVPHDGDEVRISSKAERAEMIEAYSRKLFRAKLAIVIGCSPVEFGPGDHESASGYICEPVVG